MAKGYGKSKRKKAGKKGWATRRKKYGKSGRKKGHGKKKKGYAKKKKKGVKKKKGYAKKKKGHGKGKKKKRKGYRLPKHVAEYMSGGYKVPSYKSEAQVSEEDAMSRWS